MATPEPDIEFMVFVCFVILAESIMGVWGHLVGMAFIIISLQQLSGTARVCPSSCREDFSPVGLIRRCIGYLQRWQLQQVQDILREQLHQTVDDHQEPTESDRPNAAYDQGTVRHLDTPAIATNLSDSLTPQGYVSEQEPCNAASWEEARACTPVCEELDDSHEDRANNHGIRKSESERVEGAPESMTFQLSESVSRPMKPKDEVQQTEKHGANDHDDENSQLDVKGTGNIVAEKDVSHSSTVPCEELDDSHEDRANNHGIRKSESERVEGAPESMNSQLSESVSRPMKPKDEVQQTEKHGANDHDDENSQLDVKGTGNIVAEKNVSQSSTVSCQVSDDKTLPDCSSDDSDEQFVTGN